MSQLYTFKEVADRAGCSAHRLRQWMRRFALFESVRAENGYHLFGPDDIELARYLCERLSAGDRLQTLAARGRTALLEERRAAVATPSYLPSELPGIANFAVMLSCLERDDPAGFARELELARKRYPRPYGTLKVDLAVLRELGQACAGLRIPPVLVLRAATVIRRRLEVCIAEVVSVDAPRPVLLAAPHDQHDIGLLTAQLVLGMSEIPVRRLPAQIPLDDLAAACRDANPRAVAVALSSPLLPHMARETGRFLSTRIHRTWPVVLGGFEALRQRSLFMGAGLPILTSVDELVAWVIRNTS